MVVTHGAPADVFQQHSTLAHACVVGLSMACEARILRVLRTLEYPGFDEAPGSGPTPALGLAARPDDLAKIVAWIEDRKVRTRKGVGRLGKAGQLLLAKFRHIVGVSLSAYSLVLSVPQTILYVQRK